MTQIKKKSIIKQRIGYLLLIILLATQAHTQQTSKKKSPIHIWGHLFCDIKIIESTSDLNLYTSWGIQYKYLFIRSYHNLQYKNHFLFTDHHISANYFFSIKRHSIFAGPLFGVRIFSMGYSWEKVIYGFNLGYLFRITNHFHIGAEYFLYKINGSELIESRIALLPAIRF